MEDIIPEEEVKSLLLRANKKQKKGGGTMGIILKEKIDWEGGETPIHYLEYVGGATWREVRICENSSLYGLGTCCCNSHPCSEEWEVGPGTVLLYLETLREHYPRAQIFLTEEEKRELERYRKDPIFKLESDLLYFKGMSMEEFEDFLKKLKKFHVSLKEFVFEKILKEFELEKDFIIEEIFIEEEEFEEEKARERLEDIKRFRKIKKFLFGIVNTEEEVKIVIV